MTYQSTDFIQLSMKIYVCKGENMAFTKKKKTTKKKSGSPKPANPALYARMKAKTKKKFKVYPSAYANAYLVREYKKAGGTYT